MAHSVSVDLTYSPVMLEQTAFRSMHAVLSPAGEEITGPNAVTTSASSFPFMLLFENVEVGDYNVTTYLRDASGNNLCQTTTAVGVASNSPAAFQGGRGGIHYNEMVEGATMPFPISIVIDSGISRQ